ncbi:MAG: 50S ribosome-binding GTPase [Thermoguttaceae bacterium]|nr:50S ribosome-binding GTPase [Thermoguttaceae bacterium]MDW8079492.1 GTPase [Thermoguttaceae bacterium]
MVQADLIREQAKETIVARLTAPGRAAVATVGLFGPQAEAVACRVLFSRSGKPIASLPVSRIRTCQFRWGDGQPEQVVVCQLSAGLIHIHCHGGWAAVARLLRALVENGAREVTWSEWIGAICPASWQAECLRALAHAPTARVAAILADQLGGAFARELGEVLTMLDRAQVQEALRQLELLRGRSNLGRRLLRPWFILLAGPTNAGKSSLFNSLVGYQRVIVHDLPGTTRDVVKKNVAIDGWPVILGDSAGFRPTGDPVEQAAMQLARNALAEADVVLWVEDLTQAWVGPGGLISPQPTAEGFADRPKILYVHNKADLISAEERGIRLRGRPVGLVTSATTGEGLPALWLAISKLLIPEPLPPQAGIPFTAEQESLLERTLSLVRAGKLDKAKTTLHCYLAACGQNNALISGENF